MIRYCIFSGFYPRFSFLLIHRWVFLNNREENIFDSNASNFVSFWQFSCSFLFFTFYLFITIFLILYLIHFEMTSGMLLGKVERYSFVRGSGNNITLSKFIRGSSQGWNFEPGRGNTLTKSAVHFLQIELSHRTLLMNIQLSICKSRAGKKCGEVRLTEWCFIPPHIKRTMCLFLTGGEPREKMAGLLHERINAMFVFVRITKLALYKLYTICIRNWRIFHVLENLTSNFSLDLLGLLILFPRLEFSCRRMFTNFEENLKKI